MSRIKEMLKVFPKISAVIICMGLYSCSATHAIRKMANSDLILTENLRHAHAGICIYDPATGKYLYGHEEEKYFTPASNTKLYTLYTGLSFLGDSTSGICYQYKNDTLVIQGTGDPSLFHPDYEAQAAVNFLQHTSANIILFTNPVDVNAPFGPGWAWDDYSEDYQPERSALPVYGNVIWCHLSGDTVLMHPDYFEKINEVIKDTINTSSFIWREQYNNIFHYTFTLTPKEIAIPFKIFNGKTTVDLLSDTLHKKVIYDAIPVTWKNAMHVKNIPADSLYRNMMYRSDNFFAEQVQQMCSYKLFDTISTGRMIHYMLGTKLKDLPQKPEWVDGSGLSRYNLFTPKDMVYVLTLLYKEFPKERLYHILPTGGTGTLSHLYTSIAGSIFAKTGTLSNNSAISGYLITRKGRTLIFSLMIGNYTVPSSQVRKEMEKFLLAVRKKY